jgi:hypothetical protein
MSVLLDFNRSTDVLTSSAFGTRNGIVTLQQPIMFDSNKKKGFRVLRCILSPEIPNVYSYNGYDSTKINISNDGGATWVTVQLKTGIYTVQMIQDSVNDVANQLGWYTKSTDPAIVISYNPATQFVYTRLDSTKLAAPGQIGINYGVSQMYAMLGYTLAGRSEEHTSELQSRTSD